MVGSFFDDDASGSAYAYRQDPITRQWQLEQKLTATGASAKDGFGWSVGVRGDVIVVGAPECLGFQIPSCTRTGSAYVFRFDPATSTWNEEAKLTASDAAAGDFFGNSVSTNGEAIVVGAERHQIPGDDSSLDQFGATYVFRFDPVTSTWSEEARLVPSDPAARFGFSVGIDGDAIVVGAPWDDSLNVGNPFCLNGSAFVFRFDPGAMAWAEEDKLTASDAFCLNSGGEWFGNSVAIRGDVITAGAREDDTRGFATGAAYVFRLDPATSDWIEEAKLTASDSAEFEFFGTSVSVGDIRVVVGAPGRSFGPTIVGKAYVFEFVPAISAWFEEIRLHASDGDSPKHLGGSVSVAGETAFLGAHNDAEAGGQAGAAYVFAGLGDCNANDVPDVCDIAAGVPDVNGNGIPDVCEDGDGDGIFDEVDTLPDTFSDDFSDLPLGGTTTGTVADRGGQVLRITEEPNPDGVRISILPPGPGTALFSICGGAAQVAATAGDELVVTCSSASVQVVSGSVDVTLFASDGTRPTTTLAADNGLVFDPETYTITAPISNTEVFTVFIGSEGFPFVSGESMTFDFPDGDEDGQADMADNCTEKPNPDQRDTNEDGYGNRCDADLNNDGAVDFLDLGLLKAVFFTDDADADFNGDGSVNFLDLGLMKSLFFQPPGPSGLACAGTVPCP